MAQNIPIWGTQQINGGFPNASWTGGMNEAGCTIVGAATGVSPIKDGDFSTDELSAATVQRIGRIAETAHLYRSDADMNDQLIRTTLNADVAPGAADADTGGINESDRTMKAGETVWLTDVL